MFYDLEKLDDAFNKLPEKLQDFILSDEVIETVNLIADEYLPERGVEDFALTVFAILCGIGTIEELTRILERYRLDEDQVASVLIDIDETLLDPAYDYLVTFDEKVLSTDQEVRLHNNPTTQFTDLVKPQTPQPVATPSQPTLPTVSVPAAPLPLSETPTPSKEDTLIKEIDADTGAIVGEHTAPEALQEKPVYKGTDPYREPLQ